MKSSVGHPWLPWTKSLPNNVSALVAGGSAWLLYKASQIGQRDAGLPPGPPTIPLLGNLLMMPKVTFEYKYTEWAREYGEIFSLKVGSGTVIVITSPSAVREILDKNSASTSDRPDMHIANTITNGKNLVFAHYNDTWRKLRRATHEILTLQACNRHMAIQQAEATQLMYDLVTCPEDFYNSVRRYSASVIFSVLLGKRTPQYSTRDLGTFFKNQRQFSDLIAPGGHPPIDLIPVLKYVPERFANWKTLCRENKQVQDELYEGLMKEIEQRMANGDGNGCYMETVCERAKEWGMDREAVALLGGTLVDAGSHTTSTYLQSLILLLVAHPEVQKKAQEEIDRVIGADRAPILKDVDDLPYLQAVIKEGHRFRPVAPLGFPHASTADLMYKGYRIPAGSTIVANNWGMFHDEKVYENASLFNPDRYLKNKFGVREGMEKDALDWKDIEFGAGRRICPGIHLARASIAINTVNFLWGFNFGKAKDPKTGTEIEPDLNDYSDSFGPAPEEFKCSITPRSARHAQIIKQEFAEATDAFVPFEHELSEQDRGFLVEQRKSL